MAAAPAGAAKCAMWSSLFSNVNLAGRCCRRGEILQTFFGRALVSDVGGQRQDLPPAPQDPRHRHAPLAGIRRLRYYYNYYTKIMILPSSLGKIEIVTITTQVFDIIS